MRRPQKAKGRKCTLLTSDLVTLSYMLITRSAQSGELNIALITTESIPNSIVTISEAETTALEPINARLLAPSVLILKGFVRQSAARILDKGCPLQTLPLIVFWSHPTPPRFDYDPYIRKAVFSMASAGGIAYSVPGILKSSSDLWRLSYITALWSMAQLPRRSTIAPDRTRNTSERLTSPDTNKELPNA